MSNTIHTTTQRGERRSIERMKREPIFDSNVIESLAYSAQRYRRNTQGEDAMRFAAHLAVFEYIEPTPL
ncbi:hypothetical protein PQR64_35755 [Paraburkholderia phytofirmans]|uniref:hypothetical protein n=1 Tax=Paraburkholderia phytofirmans TaxID=261302 RepID=UPI0038BA1C24